MLDDAPGSPEQDHCLHPGKRLSRSVHAGLLHQARSEALHTQPTLPLRPSSLLPCSGIPTKLASEPASQFSNPVSVTNHIPPPRSFQACWGARRQLRGNQNETRTLQGHSYRGRGLGCGGAQGFEKGRRGRALGVLKSWTGFVCLKF